MYDGKMFVCDVVRSAVLVFDMAKKESTLMGEGKLDQPVNIVIDAVGMRYVADSAKGMVMVFDPKNNLVASYLNPEKVRPIDVVVSKGRLYVLDAKESQVLILDPKTGAELSRFSRAGSGDGELYKATNLAADGEGNIYVSDTINGRVSVFGSEGKWLRNYGQLGDSLGHFTRPKGVAVDREGLLYAVDGAFENIQMFNKEGRLLMFFGNPGAEAGAINMPAKVAIDYDHTHLFAERVIPGSVDHLILVSNQFGDNKSTSMASEEELDGRLGREAAVFLSLPFLTWFPRG